MRALRPSSSTAIKKLWRSSRRTSRSCSTSLQSLIDHPKRTLNAAEIDAVVAKTLARQALDLLNMDACRHSSHYSASVSPATSEIGAKADMVNLCRHVAV